jgi:rfaE bifunctional protein nucleotidyltransferase chain/domain
MARGERAPIYRSAPELKSYIDRAGPGKVVLTNGCFDPLHVGHIRYLEGARQRADFLIVALNDDESTQRIKGPTRPAVPAGDRAALLSAVRFVDAVLLFTELDVSKLLEILHPHRHAKGTDYTVETVPELETSKRLGIETVIVGDPKSHASTAVLDKIRRPPGTKEKR